MPKWLTSVARVASPILAGHPDLQAIREGLRYIDAVLLESSSCLGMVGIKRGGGSW